MFSFRPVPTAITAATVCMAALVLPATPVAAAPAPTCRNLPAIAIDTKPNTREYVRVLPDRIEIRQTSNLSEKPKVVKRSKGSDTVVLYSYGGSDEIVAEFDVNLVACLHGRDARVKKKGGDAYVHFYSWGYFEALGGDNNVEIDGSGLATTGPGDDDITIGGSGDVKTGDGNDDVYIEGSGTVGVGAGNDTVQIDGHGTVFAGGGDDEVYIQGDGTVYGDSGDDQVHIEGDGTVYLGAGKDEVLIEGQGWVDGGPGDDRIKVEREATVYGGTGNDRIKVERAATIYGGPGDDRIDTLDYDDFIISGEGADVVDAGGGHDHCDWKAAFQPGAGDVYVSCEVSY